MFWRLFNFIVRRVLAAGFVVAGVVVAASSARAIFPGGTVNVDGVPNSDMVYRAFAFLMPLLIAALGVALFKAKPFDPSPVKNNKDGGVK